MIKQQCSAKGFDAVETDIDEECGDQSGYPSADVVLTEQCKRYPSIWPHRGPEALSLVSKSIWRGPSRISATTEGGVQPQPVGPSPLARAPDARVRCRVA